MPRMWCSAHRRLPWQQNLISKANDEEAEQMFGWSEYDSAAERDIAEGGDQEFIPRCYHTFRWVILKGEHVRKRPLHGYCEMCSSHEAVRRDLVTVNAVLLDADCDEEEYSGENGEWIACGHGASMAQRKKHFQRNDWTRSVISTPEFAFLFFSPSSRFFE